MKRFFIYLTVISTLFTASQDAGSTSGNDDDEKEDEDNPPTDEQEPQPDPDPDPDPDLEQDPGDLEPTDESL